VNFVLLFVILHARGQFRMPAWLVTRVGKQLLAAVAMGASLYAVKIAAGGLFFGGVLERIAGLGALVGVGAIVYFAVAWMIGGMDRQAIAALRRRAKSEELPE
jgi:putative peptidoglycan lipid II flippase